MTTNNETIANTINTEELERRLRENEQQSLDLSEIYTNLMCEHRRLMEQQKTTRDFDDRSKLFNEIKQLQRRLDANVDARIHLGRTMAVIRTELGISV